MNRYVPRSPGTELGRLSRRVVTLEREKSAAAGAGGIMFDTYPQDGTWLHVGTTGAKPSGDGSGYGISLWASDGVQVYTPNNVFIEGDTGVSLTAPSAGISLNAGGTGAAVNVVGEKFKISSGVGEFEMSTSGADFISFLSYTAPLKFTLASGNVFTIYKSNGTTKLFEVRDDNTVHIKTGETVQADL